MNKVYTRINWENEPSVETPLNAKNLNNMDKGIDDLDNKLIENTEDINGWLNRAVSILNKDTLTENYYVDGNSGTVISNSSFSLSDYTDVSNYDSIWVSYGISHFAFYDSNKSFISGVVRTSAHLPSAIYKTPSNAVYGRFSVYIDDVDIAMVGDGSKYLENPYLTEKSVDSLIHEKYGLVKNVLGVTTSGFYISESTGRLIANSTFAVSDYIEVSDNNFMSISDGVGRFAFYDSNYNFVSGVLIVSANHTTELYEIPDSAVYTRVSVYVPKLKYARVAMFTDIQEVKSDVYNSVKHIYNVNKNGGADYTSLTECIIEATRYMDSTVYVRAGVYDLESEFKALYGDTFFSSYTSTTSNRGIVLKNRIHLIFDSRTLVKFDYDGSNSSVVQYFAPFNAGIYGFTLENLTIHATNCRYNVHDERGGSTDHYVNKYLNCDFSYSTINTSFPQCIGGGLGAGGEVIIKDCVFDSESDRNITVSYHNNNSSTATDSKSRIVFTGNMVKNNGTFRLTYMGKTQKMTTAIVTNNSFGSEPYVEANDSSQSYVNTEIIGWNNIVRTE